MRHHALTRLHGLVRHLGTVRAAVVAALVTRLAGAVVFLVQPQAFPMRDYEIDASQSVSFGTQVLRRPQSVPLGEDETAYDALARALLRGDGYLLDRNWVMARRGELTAYGGAVYPLFVAAIYGVTGNAFPAVVLLQIALATLAVWGIARIAARAAGTRAAPWAAWVAALHPGLIMAPSLLMTEALSIPILVGLVLLAQRWLERPTARLALGLGALAGFGVLVRSPLGPQSLAIGAAALLGAALAHAATRRQLVRQAALGILAGLVVTTPWIARNWVRYDRFLPTDSKSGVNLWMFNRPDEAPGWPALGRLNEAQRDVAFRSLALQNIRDYPGWFARRTLARAVQFWSPVPRRIGTPVAWLGVLLYGGVTALGLAGLVLLAVNARSAPASWPVLAAFAVGWALSAMTAVGLRHRLTVEPLIVVGAGVALAAAIARLRAAKVDA